MWHVNNANYFGNGDNNPIIPKLINDAEMGTGCDTMALHDTFCVFCGSKMNWESEFPYSDLSDVEEDDDRIVVMMTCPECGCEAEFIQPPDEEDEDD